MIGFYVPYSVVRTAVSKGKAADKSDRLYANIITKSGMQVNDL